MSVTLSCVIVTKDNPHDLVSTLNSISELENIEVIVANGSEKSVPMSKLPPRTSKRKFLILEGPDRGIYHGMNRGLEVATGHYVWFLNSGDIFLQVPEFEDLIEAARFNKVEWIMGSQLPVTRSRLIPKGLFVTSFLLGIAPLPHQSTIIARSILNQLEGFNENSGIAADQELFVRLLKHGVEPTLIDIPLTARKTGGVGDSQSIGSFARQIDIFLREAEMKQQLRMRLLRYIFYGLRKLRL